MLDIRYGGDAEGFDNVSFENWTESRDEITCPHCGLEYEDTGMVGNAVTPVLCERCQKQFQIFKKVVSTYQMRKTIIK
jgi:hypothetical protein